ncbi:MAG TPA: cysteine desulfurase family protein [Burkholderiales bacterium]|nr:cysteine desulfurase family protein [Burkholderiales bacterium]
MTGAATYLDHNATTPVDEAVLAAMLPYFREKFGNASSRHEFGTVARKALDTAREQVAAALQVRPTQVIFTSGGSEANNLFLRGAAGYLKPSQIAVSAVEHPCVAKPAQELARRGWTLRKLAVDGEGRLDMADLDTALAEPTGIVSVMLANNETGVIYDVAAVAEKARAKGALVHSDAVQAFGKIPFDFPSLKVHALTLSGHKFHAPKGTGVLVVDKKVALKPQILGGGHESGLRAGTENVPAIVGLGVACERAAQRVAEAGPRLAALRERLEQGLAGLGAVIFGRGVERLPNTSYFAVPGIAGETLVIQLDQAGYACASGAACSSGASRVSGVLGAMGVPEELGRGAVRLSLGRDSTAAQVDGFLQALAGALERLRSLAGVAV